MNTLKNFQDNLETVQTKATLLVLSSAIELFSFVCEVEATRILQMKWHEHTTKTRCYVLFKRREWIVNARSGGAGGDQ